MAVPSYPKSSRSKRKEKTRRRRKRHASFISIRRILSLFHSMTLTRTPNCRFLQLRPIQSITSSQLVSRYTAEVKKMKSLTAVIALAATATLIRAQAVFNNSTGQYDCSILNGTFCASDSLQSSIIIRCTDGIGYAGNCNDNLDGEPPQGNMFSPCWQDSPSSGNAACSKNCIAYPDAGGQFSLKNCQATLAPLTPNSTVVPSNSTSTSYWVTVTTVALPCPKCQGGITTVTVPCPSPGLAFPTGGSYPGNNGTNPLYSSVSSPSPTSSSVPIGLPIPPPTSTVSSIPTFTGAANIARAGSALAAVGLFAAYFL